MKLMFILIFILFNFSVHASSLHGFCFKKGSNLQAIKKDIEFIVLPSDKLDIRRNAGCIEASLTQERTKLYETILTRKGHKITTIYEESVETIDQPLDYASTKSKKQCEMALETITHNKTANRQIKVGKKSRLQNNNSSRDGSTIMTITALEGKPALISLGGKTLYVTCRIMSSTMYELELSLFGKREGISSVISLSKGTKSEIGSIYKDLNNEANSASIRSGVVYQNGKGHNSTKYYLTIK